MYKLILHKYQCHRKEVVLSNTTQTIHKRGDATTDLRSSNQTVDGTSLHHANRCVEVKHSETPFDYQSLIYTVNKCETTH
jgi:hypothetical protein